MSVKDDGTIRSFDTGAVRSSQEGRIDPEGFLSPLVLERFSDYMHKHQTQADGSIRASDNWQKGMPLTTYAKGLWRHFLHFWQRHRGWPVKDTKAAADIQEDLCAMFFNIQGYLHEILKEEINEKRRLEAMPRTFSIDDNSFYRPPFPIVMDPAGAEDHDEEEEDEPGCGCQWCQDNRN